MKHAVHACLALLLPMMAGQAAAQSAPAPALAPAPVPAVAQPVPAPPTLSALPAPMATNPAGAVQYLGSPVLFTPAVGDVWDLILGTATSLRQFILLRNGVTVITITDPSGVNTIVDLSNNTWAGVGMEAADRNNFSTQTLPANVDSLTVTDRTP